MTRELNPKALEKAAESWGQCSESLGSYVRLQFAISAYLDETERAPDPAPSGWGEPVAWRYRDAWGNWAYCRAVDNKAGPTVITEKQALYLAAAPQPTESKQEPK